MQNDKNDRLDKVKEKFELLEKGTKEIFESDKYEKHLEVMSKFHNYSIRNQILITLQKPEATLVKGFQGWKKDFNRNVKKGEKGISIISPIESKMTVDVNKIDPITKEPIKDEKGDIVKEKQTKTFIVYKVSTVFDISQTEGKEIENLNLINELKFNVDNFNSFFNTLKSISPVEINFENISGTAKGYYSRKENRIAIQENMSEAQTVKTAIHEIAHSILHNKEAMKDVNSDRKTKEVEAESVAFIVSSYFEIDTSDYSFGYIASWSSGKEVKELQSSLETIQKTSADLIKNIEKELSINLSKELTKEEPILNKRRNVLKSLNARIGDGVILEKMVGENLPKGLKGIIRKVDDIGQIHINWENGSTLAINPEIDKFKIERLKEIDIHKIKVANDGYQLNYVPEEFKTEEICKSAVSNYGFALSFVPEKLKTEEMCKIAVLKNSGALEFVPEKLKTEELCNIAISKDFRALEFVPEDLKNDILSMEDINKNLKNIIEEKKELQSKSKKRLENHMKELEHESGFKYIIEKGTVKIIGYDSELLNNRNGILEIPTYIDDKKVTHIEKYAFERCNEIKKLIIKGDLYIGMGAFDECHHLQIVEAKELSQIYAPHIFSDNKNLQNVDMAKLEKINNTGVFLNCTNLEKINMPILNEIKGHEVFSDCERLKEIYLPQLEKINGDKIFNLCISLEKINMPKVNTIVGNHIFRYCESLKNINLPKLETIYDNETFSQCNTLKEIDLPNLKRIKGKFTFSYCEKLEKCNLPKLEKISYDTIFYKCNKLKEINLNSEKSSLKARIKEKKQILTNEKNIKQKDLNKTNNIKNKEM